MQTQENSITLPPVLSSFSESESEDDQQQQFDRISDILSTLIQEANEAVNNENPSLKSIPLVRKHSSSSFSQEAQVPQRRKKTNNYWHGSPRPVSYPSTIGSSSNSTRRSITPSNLKRRSSPVLSNTTGPDSSILTVEASVSHSRLPSSSKKRSKTPSLIKRRPSNSVIIPEPLVMEPSVSRVSQMKKSKTPTSFKRRSYHTISNQQQQADTIEPSSLPLCRAVSAGGAPLVTRRSIPSSQRALTIATTTTSNSTYSSNSNSSSSGRKGGISTDPSLLLESFKRLDSSMAEIDSLSRDLATHSTLGSSSSSSSDSPSIIEPLTPPPTPPFKKSKAIGNDKLIIPTSSQKPLTFDARLSTLLLLPLLHFPHALISMVFDSLASDNVTNSASFSSMMLFAFVFAITNLVVDKVTTTHQLLDVKRVRTPVNTLCLQHDAARCMHSHPSFEKTHHRIKRRNSF